MTQALAFLGCLTTVLAAGLTTPFFAAVVFAIAFLTAAGLADTFLAIAFLAGAFFATVLLVAD